MLAGLDEPVRRYCSHAIGDGAALPNGVRMAMGGRIKVGRWLARDPVSVHDANTARSAATRAAIESVVFAPRNPEVRVSIDEHGADISAVTPTR